MVYLNDFYKPHLALRKLLVLTHTPLFSGFKVVALIST